MKIVVVNPAFNIDPTESGQNVIFVDMGGLPIVDTAARRFVFDHHCDGRFAMLSAAGQVFQALLQGLITDANTRVCVNHTDADSVLAVWMLQHPDRVRSGEVPWGAIEHLSRIDNNGPAAALPGEGMYAFHYSLRPDRGVVDGEETFLSLLDKAEALFQQGELFALTPDRPEYPGKAFAFTREGDVIPVEGDTPSFSDIYAQGGMGVIFGDQGMVTIGKLPFFPARSFRAGLIEALNTAEPGGGWGGADSIMGSPRPGGTQLTQEKILGIVGGFIYHHMMV
jgi:hypothetical protein